MQVKPPIAEDAARIHALIVTAKADKPKIETKKPATSLLKENQTIKPGHNALKIDVPHKSEPVDPRFAEQARIKNLRDANRQPITSAKSKQVLAPVVRIDETKPKSAPKIINSRPLPDKPKAVLINQPQIVRTAERIRPKIEIILPPANKTVTAEVVALHAEARGLTHGDNIIEPKTFQKPPTELINNNPSLGTALKSLFTDRTISRFEAVSDRQDDDILDINDTPARTASDALVIEETYNFEPITENDHDEFESLDTLTTPLALPPADHTLHISSLPNDEVLPFLGHHLNEESSADDEEDILLGASIESVYPTISGVEIEDLPSEDLVTQEWKVAEGDFSVEQAVNPQTQVSLGEFATFVVLMETAEIDEPNYADEVSFLPPETEMPPACPAHDNLVSIEKNIAENYDDLGELQTPDNLVSITMDIDASDITFTATPKLESRTADAAELTEVVDTTLPEVENVDITPTAVEKAAIMPDAPPEIKIILDKIAICIEALDEDDKKLADKLLSSITKPDVDNQLAPANTIDNVDELSVNTEQLCEQLLEFLKINYDEETFNLFVQYIAKPATLGLLAEALASAIELSKQGTHEHKLKPDPDSSATILGDMTHMMQRLNPQQLLGRYVVLVAAA